MCQAMVIVAALVASTIVLHLTRMFSPPRPAGLMWGPGTKAGIHPPSYILAYIGKKCRPKLGPQKCDLYVCDRRKSSDKKCTRTAFVRDDVCTLNDRARAHTANTSAKLTHIQQRQRQAGSVPALTQPLWDASAERTKLPSPFLGSQTRTMRSACAEAHTPSLDTATPLTACPAVSVVAHSCVSMSHPRMVWSQLPETTSRSPENATPETACVCPISVHTHPLSLTSTAVASVLVFLDPRFSATAPRPRDSASASAISELSGESQIFTVLSHEPLQTRAPWLATAWTEPS
eukprot:2900746-Rhodomonas_salina.1